MKEKIRSTRRIIDKNIIYLSISSNEIEKNSAGEFCWVIKKNVPVQQSNSAQNRKRFFFSTRQFVIWNEIF